MHLEIDVNDYSANSRTATVGELIHFLQAYDDTTPIYATWEGVQAPIQTANIAEEK